ncbi:MAG: tetratricopeptide repeat protein [Marinilabiliaceae bacterium]|nr:tetratricopeptide repeat protein [Marinilabiliaceae bacterium]
MIFRKLFIVFIVLFIWGCSTKKNTWLSRNYHNLTAYYNVYYNGRESFELGDKTIKSNFKNDYTRVLPLFEVSDADAAGIATGEMDRVIEKATKLIKRHSITVKPKKRSGNKDGYGAEFYNRKEFNNWVDDAYLLIGKAQVYKHEFLPAIRTFQYVNREFDNTPAQYEALIWLARAHGEQGDFVSALSALESYDLGGTAPIELYGDFMSVYTDYLLKQEKYSDAIPYLKSAIEAGLSRKVRIRYQYILAQLYELTGSERAAAEMYGAVAKASPDYEMSFNAKVNKASILYGDADVAEVKKQLHKLRRDKKNKEYLDRIYYAFGRVSLQEDDEPEALNYFKKSAEVSVQDENQKGLSFREVGEIYYGRMDYVNAYYYYYDSALVSIDPEYEKFNQLEERHYGLTDLVDHLLTVQREDSLQRLANMSEPVLLAYLDGIIDLKKEEVRLAKEREEAERMDDAFFYENMGRSGTNINQAGGKWYFYNPTSLGMGKNEFEKRWGKRKFEDNWRRSDKRKAAVDSQEDDPFALPDDPFGERTSEPGSGETDDKAEKEIIKQKPVGAIPTREELMADIPRSSDALQQSDSKIMNALVEMGLVFMDRLNNYPKAIEALEDLLKRYPNAGNREEALVALYNAYRLNEDPLGMASTQKRLENEFPNSRFVAFLSDPLFLEKMEKQRLANEEQYAITYESFLFGRYTDVLDRSSNVIHNEKDNDLLDKYLLLRGLSYGKQGDVSGFKTDMETIVSRDVNSQESLLAQALLKHLEEGKEPVQGTLYSPVPSESLTGIKDEMSEGDEVDMAAAGYVYIENETYDLVVLDIKEQDINRAIYNVADYNFTRFILSDYEIAEKRLLDGAPSLVVSGFRNKVEAMDYYYSLRENPAFFNFDKLKSDQMLIISKTNQNRFFLSGLVSEYQEFFEKYYLTLIDKKELELVKPDEPLDALPEEAVSQPKEESVQEVVSEKEVAPEKDIKETPVATPDSERKAEEISHKEEQVDERKREMTKSTNDEVKKDVSQESISPASKESIVEVLVAPIPTFSLNKEGAHMALICMRKARMDYKRLTTIFTNFTRNTYGADKKVELVDVGADYKAIKVTGFSSLADVEKYLKDVNSKSFLTRDYVRSEHYMWAISEENLDKLMMKGEVKKYSEFYKSNY